MRFDPERWAKSAAEAGMRYVIFTTKHHDGFCMFDTKYTDYRITDTGCPFHSHPGANVIKAIFDAFRAEGMWVGAYFSKPDWHCDDYWDPYFAPMDRNVNYDPAAYPERWENFVQFTHKQIMELMTEYGPVDILWLDGGWVATYSEQEINSYYEDAGNRSSSGFMKTRLINQDIRMDELVQKAREKQPGLIVVDRAVEGKNQNYLTPENRVPEKALPYPWESCIIAGGSWSWVPDATYMSGREVVHLLVDIVAKGGNLLLNIAPGPEGQWHDGAYKMLEGTGMWMKVNGEAIYGTRAVKPYKSGNICFTRKDDHTLYAIRLISEEEPGLPQEIKIDSLPVKSIEEINLLGSKEKLTWELSKEHLTIRLPEAAIDEHGGSYGLAFRITFR